MALYLGIDAGGTRSSAMIADDAGTVVARADGGPANYQTIGAERARAALADVAERALDAAGATFEQLAWAGYGIAGADRPKDFEAIRRQLPPIPMEPRRTLVNDSHLVLRAGAPAGVGVALVSGTGTNAIGRTTDGRVENVGGVGFELGDFGSAGDLGREAMRRAMRGEDGRGPQTSLYGKICSTLGVEPLIDVIDLWMNDDPRAELGRLAPLVFDAAAEGDRVARSLLEEAGEEIALAAKVLVERLFLDADTVTVVLGGSVLQRGVDPTLTIAVARGLKKAKPGARVVRLEVEPVVGAVLLAMDREHEGSAMLGDALSASLQTKLVSNVPAA